MILLCVRAVRISACEDVFGSQHSDTVTCIVILLTRFALFWRFSSSLRLLVGGLSSFFSRVQSSARVHYLIRFPESRKNKAPGDHGFEF